MSNNPKLIKIKLNFSDYNADIPIEELVQQLCYENLKKKINDDLEKTKDVHPNCKDNSPFFEKYPPGSGLVYFIDGTRGAGKSTFLRAAFKDLSEQKSVTVRLAQLAYIDPSRLENGEIVLLYVLKALKDAIDKCGPNLRQEQSYQEFRNNFKKLAGGLKLFAKDHHPLQHFDPDLFLDHGLDLAGHSTELRRHLHEVFDRACGLLGVGALLLAFDDADTNAGHARKVLECIRNYLDTPRLVILVTGDMELYSLLVRDHFFDNLRHSSYDQDEVRHQQRVRMVDHLEDQYLLKLFPIQRRYQLRPLGSLLKDSSNDYALEYGESFTNRSPRTALEELIRRGLRIKNWTDIVLYREFLLQQPLRAVLQMLSRCAPQLSDTDKKGKEAQGWNENISEALRKSLRSMALGSLYKYNVDVDALANKDLPALIGAVFELALRDGDFDTAAYLRPQTKDEDLKSCFTAMAAEVAWQCAAKPSSAIQYMLAGPGSVSLFGKELRRCNGKIDYDTLLQQFREYMGIGRREDSLDWARHATAVISAPHSTSPKNRLVDFGIIGLNKKTIDTLNTGNDLPIFFLSLVDVSGISNRTYASIYNVIGLVERMLFDANADILEVLRKTYPPLSISSPKWGAEWTSAIDEEEESGKDSDNVPALSEDIINKIKDWKGETTKKEMGLAPSSIMLGKIWTRLYFSLEKAAYKLRSDTSYNAAQIMELFALCVINAFLVEEIEHHLATRKTSSFSLSDRTNPLKSASAFIEKKIPVLAEHKDDLPLTYAIATCPLILGLIQCEANRIPTFTTLLYGKQIEFRQRHRNVVAQFMQETYQEERELNEKNTKKLLCSDSHWKLIGSLSISGASKK